MAPIENWGLIQMAVEIVCILDNVGLQPLVGGIYPAKRKYFPWGSYKPATIGPNLVYLRFYSRIGVGRHKF